MEDARAAAPLAADARLSPEHRARHRRAFRVEIASQVVVVLAIIGFTALAVVAHTTPYFRFDLPIARAIQSIEWPPLVAFLSAVSWIGFPPQSTVLFGMLVVGLLVFGQRGAAAGVVFAGAGSAALWFLIPPLVERPRPSPDLIHVAAPLGSGSFPSGHVLNFTVIFGFLIFLTYSQLRPSWWRMLLLVLLAIPILTIGIARIQAGQHWPSDVLGGYILGLIWLTIVIGLYRRANQYWAHGRLFWRRPGKEALRGA